MLTVSYAGCSLFLETIPHVVSKKVRTLRFSRIVKKHPKSTNGI